jgi:hypothetical protein
VKAGRPPRPPTVRQRRGSALPLLAVLVVMLSCVGTLAVARPAAAADLAYAPPSPQFDRVIDGYLNDYDSTTCSGSATPGAVAFRDMIRGLYPSTRDYGIYGCSAGSASDHNEGRAWDWGVSAGNAYERALADRVLNWLLAPDDWGNPHAMLRRLGIKYIIWNRQIWSTSTPAWRAYSCDGSPSGCHTDHVHFSFAWPGARKQTSWWYAHRIDGPAVAVNGERLDVAVRGTNGEVWLRSYLPATESWTGWQPLGGYAKAGPAAVWWQGVLNIFVRGADDWIWQRYWTPAGWSGWIRLFGPVQSQPAAATYNGQLHALAKQPGTANTLHWWWNGSIWSFENLGGASRSGPGARQYGGQFQVVVRGTDDTVWHRFFDGPFNAWTPWTPLAGVTYSKPEAVSTIGGFRILVRGSDGKLWQRIHTNSTGWSNWGLVDHTIMRSAPAAALSSNGILYVFANSASGSVLFGGFSGSSWLGWFSDLGGIGI